MKDKQENQFTAPKKNGTLFNQDNSLTRAWGSQNRWQILRDEAVIKAKSHQFTSLNQLWNFLAEKRHEIAEKLHQNDKETLGIPRENFCITPIFDNERYEDFFLCLLRRLNLLFKLHQLQSESDYHEGLVVRDITSMIDRKIGGIGASKKVDFKSRYSGNSLFIKNGLINYSKLIKIDKIDNHLIPPIILIEHTDLSEFVPIEEKINQLYSQLQNQDLSASEKANIIKEILWNLGQAMFCERGSAAITEMVIQILCEENNIPFNYPRNYVPMDLIALFSSSPEQFIDSFSFTPIEDLKAELDKLAQEVDNSSFLHSVIHKFYCFLDDKSIIFTTEEQKQLENLDNPLGKLVDRYQFNGLLLGNFTKNHQSELEANVILTEKIRLKAIYEEAIEEKYHNHESILDDEQIVITLINNEFLLHSDKIVHLLKEEIKKPVYIENLKNDFDTRSNRYFQLFYLAKNLEVHKVCKAIQDIKLESIERSITELDISNRHSKFSLLKIRAEADKFDLLVPPLANTINDILHQLIYSLEKESQTLARSKLSPFLSENKKIWAEIKDLPLSEEDHETLKQIIKNLIEHLANNPTDFSENDLFNLIELAESHQLNIRKAITHWVREVVNHWNDLNSVVVFTRNISALSLNGGTIDTDLFGALITNHSLNFDDWYWYIKILKSDFLNGQFDTTQQEALIKAMGVRWNDFLSTQYYSLKSSDDIEDKMKQFLTKIKLLEIEFPPNAEIKEQIIFFLLKITDELNPSTENLREIEMILEGNQTVIEKLKKEQKAHRNDIIIEQIKKINEDFKNNIIEEIGNLMKKEKALCIYVTYYNSISFDEQSPVDKILNDLNNNDKEITDFVTRHPLANIYLKKYQAVNRLLDTLVDQRENAESRFINYADTFVQLELIFKNSQNAVSKAFIKMNDEMENIGDLIKNNKLTIEKNKNSAAMKRLSIFSPIENVTPREENHQTNMSHSQSP